MIKNGVEIVGKMKPAAVFKSPAELNIWNRGIIVAAKGNPSYQKHDSHNPVFTLRMVNFETVARKRADKQRNHCHKDGIAEEFHIASPTF